MNNPSPPPPTLDYATPTPAQPISPIRLVLWSVLGPCEGAVAGLVNAGTATWFWVHFGSIPYVLFENWTQARGSFQEMAACGGVFGVFFGLALYIFERISHRRMPVLRQALVTMGLAIIVFGSINYWSIRTMQGDLWPNIGDCFLVMCLAFIASVLTSRRAVRYY